MNLYFLKELDTEDFSDLINFCMFEKLSQFEEEFDFNMLKPEDVFVSLYKDEFSDEYVIVNTSYDIENLGNVYVIDDYNMYSINYEEKVSETFDKELRRFMSRKFGGDYIEALYHNELSRCNDEVNELMDYIDSKKKIIS